MEFDKKQGLLFFVKFPTPGRVKTRLAKTLGQDEAARCYRELAEANFKVLRRVKNVDLIVTFDPPQQEERIKQWLVNANFYIPQQGKDLGVRLSNAFQWAFDNGYRHVSVFGSDILGLTVAVAQQSLAALQEAEAVIGPAKDGGYYLIGLSSYQPALFEEIAWSTDQVLSQTHQIINTLGLTHHTLTPLEDLDEIGERV